MSGRGVRLNGMQCRELRRQRGYTQERLADSSRGSHVISLATIKRAERGAMIDLASATALAALLNTDLDRLQAAGERTGPASPEQADNSRGSIAVAVLPFEAAQGESDAPTTPTNYLCDGLMDDLVCRMGGWWFPVISRASTARYRDQQIDPLEAAAQLNARYVVTGTVRQHQGRVRVTAELLSAASNTVLWTGQVTAEGNDVLNLQAEMSASLCTLLGGHILEDASAKALALDAADDLDAWTTALRGAWHYYRNTRQDTVRARQYLTDALKRAPRLRCAYYWLCMTYQQELLQHWSDDPYATLKELTSCVREFRARHPHDPYMHTAASYAFVYSGDRRSALFALEEAIGAEPNIAPARVLYGQALAMSDRANEALPQLQTALALSPMDPRAYAVKTAIALTSFVANEYTEAIRWSHLAIADAPEFGLAYATLACSSALSDDRVGASEAVRALGRLSSPIQDQTMSLLMAATEPHIRERFLQGLHLAGLR